MDGSPGSRRRGLRIVVSAVAAVCIATASDSLELTELGDRLRASVVVLEVDEVLGQPTVAGTGFFVSSQGLIATNHHVIRGARAVMARTSDGRRFRIEAVVAADRANDLALIRAEPGTYPPLPLGDSSVVKAGEPVVVLGSPLGLDFTLSEGIVSAVRKAGEVKGRGPEGAHLQISAPISFGSSGSPVMNLAGEVVGVVTSGYVTAQNLNFAVPSDLLAQLLRSAAENPQPRQLARSSLVRNLIISAVVFVLFFVAFRFLVKERLR